MISKNKLKYLQQLNNKKQRTLKREFLVEGKKLVEEAILNNWVIKEVFATPDYLSGLTSSFQQTFITTEVTAEDLGRMGNLKSNSTISALVEIPTFATSSINWKDTTSLLLDNIKDPGNLGTILRTAAWFGIKNVICSEETVDVYNPKVVQSSMGALFNTNVIYQPLVGIVKEAAQIPNFKLFGADLSGENPNVLQQQQNCFLILGSESHGISPELFPYLTNTICIPKAGNSSTESLNVAVANAILCYELTR